MLWNVIARMEYRTKFMSKIFGSGELGCYVMAALIFMIGLTRNAIVLVAVSRQISLESYIDEPTVNTLKVVGTLLIVAGLILAVSSMCRLGITGTYLGDYFGMYKTERVSAFPYSFCDNPMYVGSTIAFLGLATRMLSPTGFLLTGYIWIVYYIALHFEEPFTTMIYKTKDQ